MKKNLTILSIFIIICLTSTIVHAMSVNVGFSTDKYTVKPGEEVSVIFSVKDIKDTQKGINSYSGIIEYNSADIENFKMKSLNDWDTITYNGQTKKFLSTKGTFIKEGESIINITFKIKENVQSETTTISIKNFLTANSEEKSSQTEASITLKIDTIKNDDTDKDNTTKEENTTTDNTTKEENTTTDNTTKEENTTTDNTTKDENTSTDNSTNDENTSTDNATKDENTSIDNSVQNTKPNKNQNTNKPTEMPKTGLKNKIVLGVPVLIIIAIVTYIAGNRLNK